MFTTLYFSDAFSDFEGFLMSSIGSYLESDSSTNSAWATALILGAQKKMIMLIRHAEKKEKSFSKRHEMSKWSFGDAILATDWKSVPATFQFISIEIPYEAQINVKLYTFSNFSNQKMNLQFDSINIYKLSNVRVLFFIYCCWKLFVK